MTEYVTTTPGLYPLPDDEKDELADLKGHQKHDLIDGDEDAEITQVYDDIREEAIATQEDAGLDRVVEAQFRWDDMLAHPLAVHDSVDTRGLVRYYDNNNFYREPVVEGDLNFDGDVAAELQTAAELTDDLQAVLPGPYSLFDLATDEHYGDDDAFLGAIAEFLQGEVEAFPGHETLFLLEPSLVTNAPVEDLQERTSDAIDRVANATDADVVVHTYWDSFDEKTHAHLLDAGIDAVGYDLVSDHDRNLEIIGEYGTTDDVALGLVDGQNTLVESPDEIRERIEWFEDQPGVEVDRIYATPNTEMFYLPVNKFEAKLESLGRVTAEEVEA